MHCHWKKNKSYDLKYLWCFKWGDMKRLYSCWNKLPATYFYKLITSLVNLKAINFFFIFVFQIKQKSLFLFFLSFVCKRVPAWPLIEVKLDIGTMSRDHLAVDWTWPLWGGFLMRVWPSFWQGLSPLASYQEVILVQRWPLLEAPLYFERDNAA